MKTLLSLVTLILVAALSGCATVDSRINHNRSAFASWSAEVQAAIRAEKVNLGFTPEQVRMSLGEPNRVYSRMSAEGEAEVWAYYDKKGRFSFGLGVSSGGYHGSSGGVAYDRREDRLDEATRIVLKDGRVISVESRTDQPKFKR